MVEQVKSTKLLDPITIECQKYDRDLQFLESLRPAIVSNQDIDSLTSMCISYGVDNPKDEDGENLPFITETNFFIMKGNLAKFIYEELRYLSDIVIGKEREYNPAVLPITPNRKLAKKEIKTGRFEIKKKVSEPSKKKDEIRNPNGEKNVSNEEIVQE